MPAKLSDAVTAELGEGCDLAQELLLFAGHLRALAVAGRASEDQASGALEVFGGLGAHEE